MGDLISRKALVNSLLQVWQEYEKGDSKYNAIMRGGIRKGLREVENAPAVDAEPVRHGRWKSVKVPRKWGYTAPLCSACGLVDYSGTFRYFNYCPGCGAKMDKDAMK